MSNKVFQILVCLTLTICTTLESPKSMDLDNYQFVGGEVRKQVQPKYRLMQLYIKSFADYTEQVRDYFEQLKETCPKDPRLEFLLKKLQENVDCQNGNIRWARGTEESLYNLDAQIITPSKLLYDLLGQRQIVFKFANESTERTLTGEIRDFLGLADPKCYTQVVVDKAFGEFIAKLMAKTNNDQFVLFNHLILNLYNTIPNDELGGRVKRLISASPSLWPLLQDETFESVGIDESIGDFDFYTDCIKKTVPQVVQLMHWTRSSSIIYVTREEAELTSRKLPMPSWLYPVKQRSETKSVKVDEIKKIDTENEPNIQKPQALIPTQPEFPPQESMQGRDTKQTILVKPSTTVPDPEGSFALRSKEEESRDMEVVVSDFGNLDHLPAAVQRMDRPDDQSGVTEEVEQQVVTEHIQAAGNRKLHPNEQPEVTEEVKHQFAEKLNSGHVDLLRKIFDKKRSGQGFCYRELENLWEHLNGAGSITSTGRGSSHRVLKWSPNQDGKLVIVGSTYTHGPNHTYTSNTVRYIRDAFVSIGYPWGLQF